MGRANRFAAGLALSLALSAAVGFAAASLVEPTSAAAPQTCGVSIGIASYPSSVLVGNRGTVAFTLDGPNPLTRVQVLLDGAAAGEVLGQELRDMAAMRFSVPRTPKTYNLTVSTRDSAGCVTTTTAPRPLEVVAALADAPTISCPRSQKVATLGAATGGLYDPTTTGGIAPVTVTCTPASGTPLAVGSTTNVSCRATDAAGRSTGCVFPVTVQLVTPSTTPLTLTCPSGVTVPAGGGTTFTMPTPSGGEWPYITICDHNPTDPFPLGLTTVQCSASDFNSTSGSCSFTVTVTAAQEPGAR